MHDSPDVTSRIHRAALTPLVRQALDNQTLEVDDWRISQLSLQDGTSTGRAIYRVAGTAHDRSERLEWSLILKVIQAPVDVSAPEYDPTYCTYWKREPLAYRAGLLDSLNGGLAAPRCFDVSEPSSNTVWMWLEEITDDLRGDWPLSRYRLAARHLGEFNGAYVMRRSMPAAPWLSRGWLRSRTSSLHHHLDVLHDPNTWSHPLVRRAFPVPAADMLLYLYDNRERLLQALARLPHTLCHLDAWRGNLFASRTLEGRDRTVAIDWAFVGSAALVWVSLLEFHVEVADAAALEEGVLLGYMEGLCEAGWRGNSRLVRLGYTISSLLQWGILPDVLSYALDEEQHAALELQYKRPIEQNVEQAAAVTYLLLDRATEAYALLG